MNLIKLYFLSGSLLMFVSISSVAAKENKGDDFLQINNNIQNKDLRADLEELREEFNLENDRIQKYYNEKIEALKGARHNELKTIKNDFAVHREVMMSKYVGSRQKKYPIETPEPIIKAHGKMNVLKENKKIRKP